ncbi:hypothetical protein HG536_0H04580 [Torulaspora globosa]|uniref:SGTA homodimerisation domain-containing protein n=1 Tax=Torulaspora globosa TaxID=48254 RepID=A0A7G3ZNJ6_9SACH|nr:uncharacterized protein HG536_0H04580 [Torulaspora globosa]QLL35082.1 hypothetical protein HG536_0H04580 [Torulaspora globosa]
MSPSNKEVASLIIDYLAQVIEDKKVSDDAADSLNVAIDCIAESFEVQKGDSEALFGGKSLLDLLEVGSGVSASASQGESIQVNIPPEDAETKAKAEALKLEGNKAMASRDFELAVKKYTEAIAVLPTNAVYFANRAAAHSSLKAYEEAVKDAESAIKTDPSYSKGYSRLGYAKFALGRAEEALEAYKKVLDIEGDNASDVMKRDYETAKKKVEQSLDLEKKPETKSRSEGATGAGGFGDIASMLGNGLGGLLNNPQLMQAAQQMMQNPQAMQQMESLMQNPGIRQMAENFAQGNGAPNMSDLMNNPALREMAGNIFGGSGPGDASSNGGSGASGDVNK